MAESIIYFIERQSDKAIKIGTTHNLKPRLLSLKLEHGEIKLLGIISGNVVKEKLLHWIFKDHRVDGEFFNPDGELLEIIEEYASVPVDIGRTRNITSTDPNRRLRFTFVCDLP